LTGCAPRLTLTSMEIHLASETEERLNQLAAERGCAPEFLVLEAVQRFIDYDEWFLHEVDKGLAQIEAGELLEHEEVGRRLEKLIAEKRQPV